jgi:hypothetical protein
MTLLFGFNYLPFSATSAELHARCLSYNYCFHEQFETCEKNQKANLNADNLKQNR